MATEQPIGPRPPPQIVGRYALFSEVASGGMATVHIGRLMGPVGFSRTVAIKRLHPQFARDPEFVSMALDEARLAARIQHPNVVSVLDVVALEGELFLVMDFIQGDSLAKLLRAARTKKPGGIAPPIACSIMAGALHGLHAAHEARSERGAPLKIVHRDVSPQNILVGTDGVARVVDFGIAMAANRVQTTRDGQLKGKLSYMAPEQLTHGRIDCRTDIYAASVVLWEALTGRRLCAETDTGAILMQLLYGDVPGPRSLNPDVSAELERVVMRGLARDSEQRFPSAKAMAQALEDAITPATSSRVGAWVEQVVAESLEKRARQIAEIEHVSSLDEIPSSPPREHLLPTLHSAPIPRDESTLSANISLSSTSGEPGSTVTTTPGKRRWLLAVAISPILLLAGVGVVRLGTDAQAAPEPSTAHTALTSSAPAQPVSVPVPPGTVSATPVPPLPVASSEQAAPDSDSPAGTAAPSPPVDRNKTKTPREKSSRRDTFDEFGF